METIKQAFRAKTGRLSQSARRSLLSVLLREYGIAIRLNETERDLSPTRKLSRHRGGTRGYPSKERCVVDNVRKPQTNERHRDFRQIWHTVGSAEEFVDWAKPTPTVIRTYDYLARMCKKAVYVSIKDNSIAQWLPFSNVSFENDFANNIPGGTLSKFKNKYRGIYRGRFIEDHTQWIPNGINLKIEREESDRSVALYYDMFMELVSNFHVPDADFFINVKDFPVIRKDRRHPFPQLYADRKGPVVRTSAKMSLIFSCTAHDDYLDVPLPTPGDWNLVTGKFYPDECANGESLRDIELRWAAKKNKLVFRGSPTGEGVTAQQNMRLKAATLGLKNNDWDLRVNIPKYPKPRVENGIIRTLRKDPALDARQKMSIPEQSQFKYILHIQGHTSAWRLSRELHYGSCVLIVESPYKMWYEAYLTPWVHYVPVAGDLSNLSDLWDYLKKNDAVGQRVAAAGRVRALELFNKSAVLRKGILADINEDSC